MNALPPAAPRPLLDLLGARWTTGARAAAVAWGVGTDAVAFGLSNGSVAVAPRTWQGAPTVRPRGGGVEVVPAAAPPPAAVRRIPVHRGACVALVADPDGGFLSGGTDGQFTRVQTDGTVDTLGRTSDTPLTLASGPGRWRLCAAGRTLVRLGAGARTLALPNAVTALAVAPDGSRVAIGHAGGITLWAGGDAPRRFSAKGIHTDLAWSQDAGRLASATGDGDVVLWDVESGVGRKIDEGRGLRRSIGITADGLHLVTSASGLVACWEIATSHLVACGVGSKDAVLQVACHPRRSCLAAGYANGAVLICQPRSADVLFVRGAGGGAIDALNWSPNGTALAFAASSGEIGLVVLPDLLFRDGGAPTP